MKYRIELDGDNLSLFRADGSLVDLVSQEAFEVAKKAWVRMGWDTKYVYSFTWMGRPIIQLPDDMLRIQEVIYEIKPTVIIETGIAHGGSLIFYASLLKLMGNGKVIGVDIDIRAHNKKAMESHPLSSSITMIEGSSVDHKIFDQLKSAIKKDDITMVILDSCHTKDHVLKELELYSQLVSVGSYIVATDGVMEEIVGAPRTNNDWSWNNPKKAVEEFLENNSDFVLENIAPTFNESYVDSSPTYWPCAYLRRVK